MLQAAAAISVPSTPTGGAVDALDARIEQLETEVAQLKSTLARLCQELGVTLDD